MRRWPTAVVMVMLAAACSDESAPEASARPTSPTMSVEFQDSAAHRFSASERRTIDEIADAAFSEVSELLPDLADEVTLVVSTGTFVIAETGEVGAATRPGEVSWTVDPSRDGGVEGVARLWLRATLFHELHHLARGYTFESGGDVGGLMGSVVSEGLATAFQRDAAGAAVPWADYPPEVRAWVDQLLALPIGASRQEWMFEHPDGRRWIGYRAGTYLADLATRASGRSAADLVRTPVSEILGLAGIQAPR